MYAYSNIMHLYFSSLRDIMSSEKTDLGIRNFKRGDQLDSITTLIKDEIKKQYGSMWKFSKESGIPYSTITSMINRGLNGTAYGLVMQVCKLLNIKQVYDNDLILFNEEFFDVYSKLTELDDVGVHTVTSVLNAEYQRCSGQSKPVVKGLNGIGIAKDDEPFEEKRLRRLVKKVKSQTKDE